jgi:hypothetical protein
LAGQEVLVHLTQRVETQGQEQVAAMGAAPLEGPVCLEVLAQPLAVTTLPVLAAQQQAVALQAQMRLVVVVWLIVLMAVLALLDQT